MSGGSVIWYDINHLFNSIAFNKALKNLLNAFDKVNECMRYVSDAFFLLKKKYNDIDYINKTFDNFEKISPEFRLDLVIKRRANTRWPFMFLLPRSVNTFETILKRLNHLQDN